MEFFFLEIRQTSISNESRFYHKRKLIFHKNNRKSIDQVSLFDSVHERKKEEKNSVEMISS